ncbi:MAG: hypothetical protein ACWA5W_01725 [Phycisphaerales bacterium]
MVMWILFALLIAIVTAVFTLLWWKVGDQWADEEYKKFGHGGGAPKGPAPKVIRDFDAQSDSASPVGTKPVIGSKPDQQDAG